MRALLFSLLFFLLPTAVPATALAGTGDAPPPHDGEALFAQKCASCHSIGAGRRVGPDLAGVTGRRSEAWLVRWITKPDQVLAEKDPVALTLLAESSQIAMPNLGVSDDEARALLGHIRRQSAAPAPATAAAKPASAGRRATAGTLQSFVLWIFLAIAAGVVAVFAVVANSTNAPADVDMKRAYRIRRVLFVVVTGGVAAILAFTMPRAPYAEAAAATPDRVVYVAARQFAFTFSSEPIRSEEDLAKVEAIASLDVPLGSLVEFRVTSLDVNHGFGVYGPDALILGETQAMPGYVNRLRVKFAEPGEYDVLCLEYCGAAHHVMRSSLGVK